MNGLSYRPWRRGRVPSETSRRMTVLVMAILREWQVSFRIFENERPDRTSAVKRLVIWYRAVDSRNDRDHTSLRSHSSA
jgi:hypothetical protein